MESITDLLTPPLSPFLPRNPPQRTILNLFERIASPYAAKTTKYEQPALSWAVLLNVHGLNFHGFFRPLRCERRSFCNNCLAGQQNAKKPQTAATATSQMQTPDGPGPGGLVPERKLQGAGSRPSVSRAGRGHANQFNWSHCLSQEMPQFCEK
ncbi:MAG: hypothetical protein HC829_03115 [Bacteroidales bacterium]|nr:hypothetical protein [Bacteroidales bacterium]